MNYRSQPKAIILTNILILLLCFSVPLQARTSNEKLIYQIGQYSQIFSVPGIPGQLPVYFLFPSHGDALAQGLFPLVIIAHGYFMTPQDYRYLAEALASRGYIVALPARRHSDTRIKIDFYAKEVSYLQKAISNLNTDKRSRLYGHIATKTAVIGHSTGGGASLMAAASGGGNLSTVITLAALGVTNPIVYGTSPVSITNKVKMPTLVIDSEKDCITPTEEHAQALYEQLPGEKQMVQIQQGDHCGFADHRGPRRNACEAVEWYYCAFKSNKGGQTISPKQQNDLVLKLVSAWLDRYLKGLPND